jgi:hypothetical protein
MKNSWNFGAQSLFMDEDHLRLVEQEKPVEYLIFG